MWVRDHPCPVNLSGLSCKINLQQEKKIKHRQKTEKEKQIAITNSIWVPEVLLMSEVMRCAHIFQGQTLIKDKFSLSHCFYCKTLVPSKLCVTRCNIIITSSVMLLPWHILTVLSYSSILQTIFLILLGQPKHENAISARLQIFLICWTQPPRTYLPSHGWCEMRRYPKPLPIGRQPQPPKCSPKTEENQGRKQCGSKEKTPRFYQWWFFSPSLAGRARLLLGILRCSCHSVWVQWLNWKNQSSIQQFS